MIGGRLPICLLAVFAVLLNVAGAAAPAAAAVEQQLQFADGLMARDLYEHAIREYLIFQEQHQDYAAMDVIHFRVGECYRHLANRVAAVMAYQRVIQQFPQSAYRHRAMLRRAEMYRLSNSPQIAVRLLRELIAERPAAEIANAAQYWLGISLAASGERETALQTWRDFLQPGRENEFTPYAALELGKFLADLENTPAEEAVTWLRSVSDQPPDSRAGAEALYYLARLAERSDDRPRAALAFDELRERYPDDVRVDAARLPAAWAYYRADRYADSLRLCAAFMEANPEPDTPRLDEWLYLKANNERRLGQYALAAATYRQLLQQTPRSALAAAAALEKAQSEFKLGDFEQSLQTMKTVRITDRNRLSAYWMLATAHEARQADNDAIQYYRMLIEQFPDSDEAYEATYRLGMLFERLGDRRQAAEYFQRVAARFADRPMAPAALMASAEMLRAIDRHAEAVRDYSLLLQRYPDYVQAENALYRKAVGEAHLERSENAIASFREFYERFPESDRIADAAFLLGVLHTRQGDHAAAETEFARGLAAGPDDALRTRILFRHAVALQHLQRDSESAAVFRQLLDDPRMDRFDPPLLEWLSVQLRTEQRYPDAIRAADLLVERAAGQAEWVQAGHALAGLAAADGGDPQVSRRRLEAALAVRARTPFAAEAAVVLGEHALRDGRIADARTHFQQGEEFAQDDTLLVLRARALLGLGACLAAENELAAATRYYLLVGLTFDIPELSEQALRQAVAAFETLNRHDDRDKILKEIEQRYGSPPDTL